MAATPAETRGSLPAVLSRHTEARNRRCDLRAWNLNAWCRVGGNPFVGPVVLMPNGVAEEHVAVEYGPIPLREGTDTMALFLASSSTPVHEHVHEVQLTLLGPSAQTLAAERITMRCGEERCETLSFELAAPAQVSLRMAVAFDDYAGGRDYGNVRLNYLLAYRDNALVALFNSAGSDKGTTHSVGRNAAPHCYALHYDELLSPLRDRDLRMLEIGLQAEGGDSPSDAPSLRVWREYFPHAHIYGYDINDFGFFEQERTTVVQGDQSSRDQLAAFADAHGAGAFGLILDDGSHAASHQQISLGALFELVEPGGMYIIEDLHWQPFPETPTTLKLLREFRACGQIRSPFLRPEEARYLEEHVHRVEIHQPNDATFAVIYKKVV